MDPNQKLIEERVAKLPPYIRNALSTINWAPAILEIGKKHGLHIDEMGVLQTETVLVLVGLVHPDEYPGNLRNHLSIPKDKIDLLVADVNEKIFKNIRQALIDFITAEDAKEGNAAETESIFKKTGIELDPEITPTNLPTMNTNTVGIAERSILEHAGVEVNEDRPIQDEEVMSNRVNILSDLEHPPKGETQFSHLIRSKLSDTVINPPEKTKYEDTKPAPTETPKRSDPYREPI